MSDDLRERIAQAFTDELLDRAWLAVTKQRGPHGHGVIAEMRPILVDAILPTVEQAIREEREKAQVRPDLTHDVSLELAAKDWARDDNLWTTQETVQSSLICFGRYLWAKRAEPLSLSETDAVKASYIRGYARLCEVAANNLHRADVAESALAEKDAQIAALRTLLNYALNGWGAHARKDMEHEEIGRIRREALRETPAPPQEPKA